MVEMDFQKALNVTRQESELVLSINGSHRELLYFAVEGLPERTAEALSREDMDTVKRHLIASGWDFLNNEFVLARLLAEADIES